MMRAVISAAEAAAAVSGKWVGGEASFDRVYTDSRVGGKNALFLALAGERFDGHDFLGDACAKGCSAVCVASGKAEKARASGIPALVVEDTLSAYQKLARLYRLKFPRLKLAAVTGSVGKTSVKEMLRAVFIEASAPENVLATEGNTNNQIGVPQNLFRLTEEHRFAVIEMGTSAPGEIEPLSWTATPDAAIVNSVAPCHLEKLVDLAGVAREKGMVAAGLSASGTAVLPFGAPERRVLEAACAGKKILWFGDVAGCDFYAEYLGGDLKGSSFVLHFPDGDARRVTWSLGGAHQALNAAGAAAVAWSFGIDREKIVRGLPATRLPGMRMKRTTYNGVTYLNDAYNANPVSMKATLAQLAESGADPEKLVLVLGGMRELGDVSENAHREIFAFARKRFPRARIVTVGNEFENVGSSCHFPDSGNACLDAVVRRGDLVFLKGSRGIALEKLLPSEAR